MKQKKETTKKDQKSIKNALYDIDLLYKARNEAINFFDEYSSMESEAKNKAENKGKGLKILTPKQFFQRLPIALAQVKAGNNSENLLHEIRQIFILCINQKKSLKKYTIT